MRLFKQEIGITFYQTLTNIRMEKAKQDLINSNKKVHEIAAEIGFEDPRYFAQVFRKFNRLSPLEYRKRYQKR
jgi:two-component system response regulator YesN